MKKILAFAGVALLIIGLVAVRLLYEKTVPILPNETPLDIFGLDDEDVDSLIRWAPDSKSVVFSVGNRQVKATFDLTE